LLLAAIVAVFATWIAWNGVYTTCFGVDITRLDRKMRYPGV
jgi:hypothetical protein